MVCPPSQYLFCVINLFSIDRDAAAIDSPAVAQKPNCPITHVVILSGVETTSSSTVPQTVLMLMLHEDEYFMELAVHIVLLSGWC